MIIFDGVSKFEDKKKDFTWAAVWVVHFACSTWSSISVMFCNSGISVSTYNSWLEQVFSGITGSQHSDNSQNAHFLSWLAIGANPDGQSYFSDPQVNAQRKTELT